MLIKVYDIVLLIHLLSLCILEIYCVWHKVKTIYVFIQIMFQRFVYFDYSLACSSFLPILLFFGMVFLVVGWLVWFGFEFWGLFA